MVVVDGVSEVLKAARENLRRGATQIKIAVGGGTGSYADPLDVAEFTPEEIRAAVQAALTGTPMSRPMSITTMGFGGLSTMA
jgi:imidazolonepropionase-like amidohydrolase